MAKGVEKEALKDVSDEVKKDIPKQKKILQEAVYSINELAANARKVFGTRQECVIAALKANGRTEYTVSEAKHIVDKFLRQEVE